MIDARTQTKAGALTRRPGYYYRRHVAAIAIMAVIVLSLFSAASCSPDAPFDSTGEPRISFEENSIHLGPAHPGQEVYAEFKFHNDGDATLVISEIATESLVEGC